MPTVFVEHVQMPTRSLQCLRGYSSHPYFFLHHACSFLVLRSSPHTNIGILNLQRRSPMMVPHRFVRRWTVTWHAAFRRRCERANGPLILRDVEYHLCGDAELHSRQLEVHAYQPAGSSTGLGASRQIELDIYRSIRILTKIGALSWWCRR